MKIGYRTVKTAIGAPLSVYIAHLLGLDFYVSAGILTILCIQPTRRSSVTSSASRFASCMIAILFCFIIFETLGYRPISIGILIATFLPALVYLRIQQGFVTSSVIIFHIYTLGVLSWSIVYNELLIITIGIGVALILNLYMPNMEKSLLDQQNNVEECFRIILKELAYFLQKGESYWSGKEFLDAEKYIKTGKDYAMKDIENHLIKPKESYYFYFSMRERQFEILERMLPIISSLNHKVEQRELIADYLLLLSERINPKDTVSEAIERLEEMKEHFEQTDLPKTREEFETRAALFYLIYEIRQFLIIKEKSFQRS